MSHYYWHRGPDQTAPFVPFDLDDYLVAGIPELITWAASDVTCLEVSINHVTNVVTVTDPGGCGSPEAITFTAAVVPCADIMSDSDQAVFDPGASAVPSEPSLAFSLGYPQPNPCSSAAKIAFSVPSGAPRAKVTLAVYDIAGHLIRTLVSDGGVAANTSIVWDGTNDEGFPVTCGTYFFQLGWNGRFASQRVVLIR